MLKKIIPAKFPVIDFAGMTELSRAIKIDTEEQERQFRKLEELSSKELLGKSRTIIIDSV